MRKSIVFQMIVILCVSMFSSCGGVTNEEDKKADSLDLLQDSVALANDVYFDVLYSLPSPTEILRLVNEDDFVFRNTLTNPTSNAAMYVDSRSQSLNLGVYTADLAYATLFKESRMIVDLYSAIQDLETSLHIATPVRTDLIDRLKANINNADSIYNISNEVYFDIVGYLEFNDRYDTFIAIAVGSFVESLHITINAIDKFDPQQPIVQTLCDHRFTIEQLVEVIEPYKHNDLVKEEYQTLLELEKVFLSLTVSESNTTVTQTTEGNLVFDNGGEASMNEKQYKQIKALITKLRDQITKTK